MRRHAQRALQSLHGGRPDVAIDIDIDIDTRELVIKAYSTLMGKNKEIRTNSHNHKPGPLAPTTHSNATRASPSACRRRRASGWPCCARRRGRARPRWVGGALPAARHI